MLLFCPTGQVCFVKIEICNAIHGAPTVHGVVFEICFVQSQNVCNGPDPATKSGLAFAVMAELDPAIHAVRADQT
jgi:hypothetical protein